MEGPSASPHLRSLSEVGRWLVAELDLELVLERLLGAAREGTGARYAALGVLDSQRTSLERFVHSGIPPEIADEIGDLPTGKGVLGVLVADPRPIRIDSVADHPEATGFPPGHPPMSGFLGVPIMIRGRPCANLYLTEKEGGGTFTEEDEEFIVTLAKWAGVAIANARSVEAERLRFAMDAAEQERAQWARELHDETLQGLAAVRLMLATGRRGDEGRLRESVDRALGQIDVEIASMRALINDLRPDSLDRLGIEAALRGLGSRLESRNPGLQVRVESAGEGTAMLDEAVEVALYRVTQEAINNAVKHGGAGEVIVRFRRLRTSAGVEITDDGAGFDTAAIDLGYGIIGMRERAELAGGKLEIESSPGAGAVVTLEVPVSR